jgi:hypothetical protein
MAIRKSVLAALVAAGITAQTDETTLKKEYFKAAKGPLSKAQLPELIAALNGDTTKVVDDAEAEAKKQSAKAEKPAKAPKEPKVAKASETADACLARMKASTDPVVAQRWVRVREVLEMGKRGPTRVRIVCDDKNEDGSERLRDIKIQDLFQVKFSAGYKKPKVNGNRKQEAPAAQAEQKVA